jgi:hypothetical protein
VIDAIGEVCMSIVAATHISADHFRRAALEIGKAGENDTLPYDVDAQFVKERCTDLAALAFRLFDRMSKSSEGSVASFFNGLNIVSERLLTATGSHGFRITTKIHPFWNMYLNGLALGIAEAHEPLRSDRVHSYRLGSDSIDFFDRSRSWRTYKEATLADPAMSLDGAIVVQTDISSFYEHIYHHRLQNSIDNVIGKVGSVSTQVDRLLSQISSGRSFGLPVGSQASRVFAEAMISPVDLSLSDSGVKWHRFVDDYTLICSSQQNAYESLSVLSHALADFGLNLNRTKTTIMSATHYREYVGAQLGQGDDAATALREVDLHFDPYSDEALADYENLKESFQNLDVQFLLDLEKDKSQPDAFVVAQISRSLKFHDPKNAEQLCATLLDPRNLDAFRASWSKIMRGVYAVRAMPQFSMTHMVIDTMLDALPDRVPHLLMPEANLLHYLKVIRFAKSDIRGKFVRLVYNDTKSQAVKRACIDCWRYWVDRAAFQNLRNNWQNLRADEQRMVWLAAYEFGEEGAYAKKQLRQTLDKSWSLGIEVGSEKTFSAIFREWADRLA